MKTILCFGDSLTWGYNPENITRYPFESRWTGALQKNLGVDYRVIEEGLNGRTTVHDDPFQPGRSGEMILPILLESHAPTDLVVILLGTNDLKSYFFGTAQKAAIGCARLVRQVLASPTSPAGVAPKVLLLAPPHFGQLSNLMDTVFGGMAAESKLFTEHYRRVAEFTKVNFLDTALFLKASSKDGIHLDVANNERLGFEVASKIKEILK